MTTTSTVVGAKTTREIPLPSVIFDPEDNYRWRSVAAMERDVERDRDVLQAMATSIRTTGLINPIGVKECGAKYRVIYGFNRFLAAREAKLKSIRAQVFPANIHEADVAALQVAENNDDMRRSVGWVREMDHYMRLHQFALQRIEALPVDKRPRTKRDIMKKPALAAWEEVAAMTGRSDLSLVERAQHYRCLHKDVLDLGREHGWSYSALREFYSGDAKTPYSDSFISAIVGELRRNFPDMSSRHITPTSVRAARARVERWVAEGRGQDGKPLWRPSSTASVKARHIALPPAVLARSYTPPMLRDLALNLLYSSVAKLPLTLSDSAAAWDKILALPAAHTAVGVGCASGDVVMPDCAIDAGADHDYHDLPARGNHFLATVATSAGVRLLVSRATRWTSWYAGSTVVDVKTGAPRSHSFLFHRAVADGMEAGGGLKARVLIAWNALVDQGAIHG